MTGDECKKSIELFNNVELLVAMVATQLKISGKRQPKEMQKVIKALTDVAFERIKKGDLNRPNSFRK